MSQRTHPIIHPSNYMEHFAMKLKVNCIKFLVDYSNYYYIKKVQITERFKDYLLEYYPYKPVC